MTMTFDELHKRLDTLLEGRDGPVPKKVLENFLFGQFDKNTGFPANNQTLDADKFSYSPEKIAAILDIAEANFKRIDALPTSENPKLFASAGGPGNGKSTGFFQFIAKEYGVAESLTSEDWKEPSLHTVVSEVFLSEKAAPVVLVAPDRLELLQLAIKDHGTPTSDEHFYLDNRAGTNFLSLSSMNAGFAGRKDIAWDTTLGSGSNILSLEYANANGYEVHIRPAASPLSTRAEAVDARNFKGGYFQSLQFNLAAQEKGFADAIPAIVKNSRTLVLSWRDEADQPTSEIAIITPQQKTISVLNQDGFNKFRALYPQIDELGFEVVPARPGGFLSTPPDTKPNP